MAALPDLTIVVASLNARASIRPCLASIIGQCLDTRAEILVADGSADGTAAIVANEFPEVRLISGMEAELVPHLWALAIAQATAPLVAITTAHCIPEPGWIDSILRAAGQEPARAGWGGPIEPPSGGRSADWAMYFSRYAAYVPPLPAGECREIPGDNAAYRKEDLDRFWRDRGHGFWETMFHTQLRRGERRLSIIPSMRVRMGTGSSFRRFVFGRLRHGRHYGATRSGSALQRLVRIAAAPILAPFLLIRIGRTITTRRRDLLGRYAMSLPWLVIAIAAWSAGEIRGYLTRRP